MARLLLLTVNRTGSVYGDDRDERLSFSADDIVSVHPDSWQPGSAEVPPLFEVQDRPGPVEMWQWAASGDKVLLRTVISRAARRLPGIKELAVMRELQVSETVFRIRLGYWDREEDDIAAQIQSKRRGEINAFDSRRALYRRRRGRRRAYSSLDVRSVG